MKLKENTMSDHVKAIELITEFFDKHKITRPEDFYRVSELTALVMIDVGEALFGKDFKNIQRCRRCGRDEAVTADGLCEHCDS